MKKEKSNQTLLDKAKAIEAPPPGRKTELPKGEEAENLAWSAITGEVRQSQVMKLLEMRSVSNFYVWVYSRLKDAIAAGRIKRVGK